MARATVLPIIRRKWHEKKIHVVGQLIVSSGSYETELSVGDLLLVSNEYRQVATILTDLTATVANAYSNNANDRAPKRLDTLVTLTGSIDVTASASVVGVGTRFLSEVSKGDLLVIGTATVGEARPVASIQSDTALTVESAFTDLANDASPQICRAINPATGRPDFTVLTGEIDPAASTNVTGVNTQFLGQGIAFDLSAPDVFSRSAPLYMDIWSRRSGLIYTLNNKERLQDLTGTIDTAASVTVPGVGTLFLSELVVGDEILAGIERRFVTAIASNTSLTVNRAHTDQANDVTPQKVVRAPSLFDLRLGVRGIPVTGGAAAAGTKALQFVTAASSVDISKEEAGNAFGRFGHLFTAAVPNIVLDDLIEFHAAFDLG